MEKRDFKNLKIGSKVIFNGNAAEVSNFSTNEPLVQVSYETGSRAFKWVRISDIKIDNAPSMEEIIEAFKSTHNLYLEAIKNSYQTHDITQVMTNDNIFKTLK